MIYKSFQGLNLSALGLGAMRLPTAGKDPAAPIDEAAAENMVDFAFENGVNYYDTAWGYHGGKSEVVLGKALAKYPRESWYLADKFPGYDLSNMDKVEEIFEEQLKRCNVTCFDFYLIHNVCERNIDAYLNKKYGIFEYLMKQKKAGRIRFFGFSAHGGLDVMKRFLEVHGNIMEFCQIQLNYIDWAFQNAKDKVDLLNEYNIPVWVMEPMRGGQLAALSDENAAKLEALRPDEKIPAWAFRFTQSVPSVVLSLTGASSLEQLRDNIETYRTENLLNKQETDALLDIARGMVEKIALPCTACRYCTEHCPQGLDIPLLLELYNEHSFTAGGFIAPMVLRALPEDKRPTACTGCKSCEAVCPQQIKIADAMAGFPAKPE